MEDAAVRFWKSLFFLTDQVKDRTISLRHMSKEWNITVQQIRLLRTVERLVRNGAKDGVMLKTLAEELNVTSASVSGMVETLVKRGILSRKQSKKDRRSVRIELAQSSREKMQQLEVCINDVFSYLTPLIGKEKMLEMAEMLEKLSRDFDSVVPAQDELVRLRKQNIR